MRLMGTRGLMRFPKSAFWVVAFSALICSQLFRDYDRWSSYSLAIKHIPGLDAYLNNSDNNDQLAELGGYVGVV